jgi:hypothetical protein
MLKSKVIPVRLDCEVYDQISQAAKVSGHSVSGYLRQAARAAALRDLGISPPSSIRAFLVGATADRPAPAPRRRPQRRLPHVP